MGVGTRLRARVWADQSRRVWVGVGVVVVVGREVIVGNLGFASRGATGAGGRPKRAPGSSLWPVARK